MFVQVTKKDSYLTRAKGLGRRRPARFTGIKAEGPSIKRILEETKGWTSGWKGGNWGLVPKQGFPPLSPEGGRKKADSHSTWAAKEAAVIPYISRAVKS